MSFWNPWKEAKALRIELEAERRFSIGMALALRRIVDNDTPRANATVKRCVRIAEAALGKWK
jgi:hypothetical protein